MEGCVSATAGSSPCHGVVHRRGCSPCAPRGWQCCALGAARQSPCVSLLLRGASRDNPPGSGLFPRLCAVEPGCRDLLPPPERPRVAEARAGQACVPARGIRLCFPWPRGPKVPRLDFGPLHLGSLRCARGCHFPEQGQAWPVGTRSRGDASVRGTQRAVTPQRWLITSHREQCLARRAQPQEGVEGVARKHLDCRRSRLCT